MKNFERLEYLLGEKKLASLNQATVAIVGLGGVGGVCAITLARSGIGHLIIQDFDVVQESNINRQMIANYQTIGIKKTTLVYEEIKKINPCCQVTVIDEHFDENSSLFNHPISFLVDAIDQVPEKILLIKSCLFHHIPFISAMGAAKKFDLKKLEIVEIQKSTYDPLAKIIRKKLREEHIYDKIMVVSSSEEVAPITNLGSYMPVTATAGLLLADYTLKFLWKGN
jgi:tRNA A37 threonylcarbamoyladenosine dehydratase